MKVRITPVVAASVLFVFPPAISGQEGVTAESTPEVASTLRDPQTVVARVNGKEFKQSDLNADVQAFTQQLASRGRRVPPEALGRLERDVLQEMISRELVLQTSNPEQIPNLDELVTQQVDILKVRIGGDDAFSKELQKRDTTLEVYTQRVRETILVRETLRKLVAGKTDVTPEEVKEFYEKNPQRFQQPELVRASHILVRLPPDATDETKAEKRAQIVGVQKRLQDGEKFGEVAKELSEDPETARRGGDLGYFPRGRMVAEFDTVAFSLGTNKVSDVVTTQYGYHLLLITERKPAQKMDFDEVKDKLANFLSAFKASEIARQHITELRKGAQVEVFIEASPFKVSP